MQISSSFLLGNHLAHSGPSLGGGGVEEEGTFFLGASPSLKFHLPPIII